MDETRIYVLLSSTSCMHVYREMMMYEDPTEPLFTTDIEMMNDNKPSHTTIAGTLSSEILCYVLSVCFCFLELAFSVGFVLELALVSYCGVPQASMLYSKGFLSCTVHRLYVC